MTSGSGTAKSRLRRTRPAAPRRSVLLTALAMAVAYAMIGASGPAQAVEVPVSATTRSPGGVTATSDTTRTATGSATEPGDRRVRIPVRYAGEILVDDAHQRVYVSGTRTTAILDFTGQLLHTIATPYRDLILAADSSAIYAVRSDETRLHIIDTTTYAVQHVELGVCARAGALTGGKLWFIQVTCDEEQAALGSYDPATGEVRTNLTALPIQTEEFRAVLDRPERLVMVGDSIIMVYDVSGETPVKLAEYTSYNADCADGAITGDAARLITACENSPGHGVFRTADLSKISALYEGSGQANAVAIAPGDRYVAAGTSPMYGENDIRVYDIANGTPGTHVKTYEFPGWLADETLEFSASGLLFAVEKVPVEELWYLNIFQKPFVPATRVMVYGPGGVPHGGEVHAQGHLSPSPGATTVSLSSTDRLGTRFLGTLPVNEDGFFGFTDTPRTTGPITYLVEYAGDATHLPGAGVAVVIAKPLPYDINGDDHAETVVGVPGETLGTADRAGMFHVLPGTATGATGSGSLAIHQNSAGVPGTAEDDDGFGHANTSGDFNGDGFADVAVSAPYESVGTAVRGGAVWVFYGGPSGLRTDNVATIDVHDSMLPATDSAYFGETLAAGDFNSDGRDDLAIGSPRLGPGYVSVFHSDETGFWHRETFSQDTDGVPGADHDGDRFGWSLAVGDTDADGISDDLAIGVPYDSEDRGRATGAVIMLYGDEYGLVGEYSQRWTKDSSGVPGVPGTADPARYDSPDLFGYALAFGDFKWSGVDSLAVGAPGSPITVDGVRKRDAGTVTVLYSDGAQLGTTGAYQISQQTSGVPGISGQEDHFGRTLAAGDANGDGDSELAVYSPGDTYVTVIPGASGGLAYGSTRTWTQNSSGIPGTTESGDQWGASLRFASVKSVSRLSLIVGAPGENSASGAFTAIHGSSTGLTGSGAQYFSQNSAYVSGTAEAGDRFGCF